MALALITGISQLPSFALSVQDRVIRLEERLRYQQLLPADLQPRIDEFTVAQLVSLRFACDAELPRSPAKCSTKKCRSAKPSSCW